MSTQPSNEPTEATAEQGEVMLDGPDGLAASFTPEAASRSAASIARAAQKAEGQTAKGQIAEGQATQSSASHDD